MRFKIFVIINLFFNLAYGQSKDSLLIRNHFKSFDKLYQVDNDKAEKYVDSIDFLLKAKPQSIFNAQLYSIKALLMEDKGESNKAIEFYLSAAGINRQLDNKKDLVKNYSTLGRIYSRLREDKEAVKYHKKAIELATENNLLKLQTKSLMEFASHYYNISKLDSAIVVAVKALKMAEENKDFTTQMFLNEHLGWYTLEIASYDKSLSYFKKSLKLSKIDSLPIDIGASHRNIGSILLYSNKNLDSAKYHFNEAVKIFKKIPVYDMLSDSYYNLAQIEDSKSNYSKAIEYLNKAQEINDRTGFRGMYLATKNLLAKQYLNLKQYKKSSKMYEEIISDTIKKDVPNDVLLSALEYNAISYERNKDLDNALKYLALFTQYNAKFERLEMKTRITDTEAKYQTEKKEKENLQLKADKAEQAELLAQESKHKWQLGAGLLTALLTLVIFAFYYRRNKKQKEVIESLQKELHHRIKNNLSIIDTFIELAKEEFDDFKFSSKLTELQNRIDSINEVHQQLYKNKDVTNLNLKNYIDTLSNNVSNSFSNNKVTIEKQVESNLNLNADKSFPIGLIINEFLTNSYKYAFGNDGGVVKIVMNDLGSNYELLLSDNGKGIPENFNIKTTESFGLRIMKLLTDQLNGEFHLYNKNGINLIINFPK